MTIKKYSILFLLLFIAGGVMAQLAGSLDYKDSSKVRAKKLAQQNEWANALPSSPLPAKPRDAWQLGIYGGYAGIFGDINTSTGWNVGGSLRKSLGYTLSVRGSLGFGTIKGMGYEYQYNLRNIPQPAQQRYRDAGLPVYVHYYKTDVITPSLDFLLSINNLMFHKKQSQMNYYFLVGYSPLMYKTALEVLDDAGNPYTYSGIDFEAKRGDIKDQLKDMYGDADFETPAFVRARRNNFDDGSSDQRQIRHSFNFGGGFEKRLGDIVSVSGEFKYIMPWNDDLVDGYRIGIANAETPQDDAMMVANVSVNFNLGLKSRKKFLQQAGKDDKIKDLGQFPGKRVAPLWMHNPLAYYAGSLNDLTVNPPKPFLDDSDNDGVIDQFDLEPNTPVGCPVDTRGRSRDTDGDGVPDCLDQELITPTACQPVNSQGIGNCPDPKCCSDRPPVVVDNSCKIGNIPSVQFSNNSSTLSPTAKSILDAVAGQIKANPNCKICVMGYGNDLTKKQLQLVKNRVKAVVDYLTLEKGIASDRLTSKEMESGGDPLTVDMGDCNGM